jgi:hypothetical protein
MVSTSVCGDGAKGRRGACRGGQVLELLAWRCEPESAAPRLRGPPAPLRGVNVSDRGCSLRARCHARSSRAQSKKKRFTIYRLWRGLLQLNVAQLIKTLTSFWGHDGGWDPDLTCTIAGRRTHCSCVGRPPAHVRLGRGSRHLSARERRGGGHPLGRLGRQVRPLDAPSVPRDLLEHAPSFDDGAGLPRHPRHHPVR